MAINDPTQSQAQPEAQASVQVTAPTPAAAAELLQQLLTNPDAVRLLDDLIAHRDAQLKQDMVKVVEDAHTGIAALLASHAGQITGAVGGVVSDLLSQARAQSAFLFRALIYAALGVGVAFAAGAAILFGFSIAGNHQAQVYQDGYWSHAWIVATAVVLAISHAAALSAPQPAEPPKAQGA